MAKAIVPEEMPATPESSRGWYRSLRAGSMFHLIDYLGGQFCSRRSIDQFNSEQAGGLGDIQYWGCCPRCMAKAKKGA